MNTISAFAYKLDITNNAIHKIAIQIYQNECSGKEDKLIHWSKNEKFPSLGIGHFVWFHSSCETCYIETFKDLLVYIEKEGYPLQNWLQKKPYCPWENRDMFYKAIQLRDRKMMEVQTLLKDTIDLQGKFILKEFNRIIGKIYNRFPEGDLGREIIEKMGETVGGIYAMVDYNHFKGSGLYSGPGADGWGLYDVITEMKLDFNMEVPTEEQFSIAAIRILTRRAETSKNGKDKVFLEGWVNRCLTYKQIL